jgi:hypothetical protein
VPGVAFSGPVDRSEDLVLSYLHVRGTVRVAEDARLYLYRPVLVGGPPVDPYAVTINQYHVSLSAHAHSSSSSFSA